MITNKNMPELIWRAHLGTAAIPMLVVARDPATAGLGRPNRNHETARPAVTLYLGCLLIWMASGRSGKCVPDFPPLY